MTDEDADLWHHATGVATEAGELLDVAKAVCIYRKPADIEHAIEEMGDLEFYLEGMRQNLGITREEVLENNIDKLGVRYPGWEYSDASAIARADKGKGV